VKRATGVGGVKLIPWPAIERREHTLSNGMRVICVPRAGRSRAVVTMLVRVGSRFETRRTNGISHFLEHMLYRGCPSHETAHDQALAFEELGASLYGATQADYGTMALSMPAESLETAFALFAEVLQSPRLSAIETERGIVRQEILEDLDDDGRLIDADNLTRALVYGDHPLGFPITGTLRTLARFDRRALRAHHARHYNAANAVLCFAGAVRPELCFRLAERRFGAMPRGKRVRPEPPRFCQKKPRFANVRNLSSQTALRVAFRAIAETDRREPAMEMLLRILDDGMSTRLYERICDARGLCYDVSALYESYEDDGVFDVAAEVQHDRVVDVVVELLSLFTDLASRGPTERELERSKVRHYWQLRAMLDDVESTAAFHALGALARTAPTPEARHAQLRGVTCEQVQRAAQAVLRRERLSVMTVGALSDAQRRRIEGVAARFGDLL
jgi:predicted Zn-dependent peptidase